MPNEKLQEIGEKLDVSDKEIKNIENIGNKQRILKAILSPVLIFLGSVLAFFGGTYLGSYVQVATYPYVLETPAGIIAAKQKGKKGSLLSKMLVPVIAFMVGIFFGYYALGIMYNVYKR